METTEEKEVNNIKEEIIDEPEELEVTVEVLPQTVNEIVYMTEQDSLNIETSYYIPSEDEIETEPKEMYEIGSVDTARLSHTSLVLDESQSFVLLQPNDIINANTLYITEEVSSEHLCDKDDGWNLFKCNICKFYCESYAALKTHQLIHKNGEFKCKVCGQVFSRAQALSHHFKISHKTPKLICNICGCPCIHEGALLSHYKKHEPKEFSCDVCSAGYDNAIDLNNHKKTHGTTMLYACNKCDAEFSSTSDVSLHLRHVHAKPKHNITPLVQQNMETFSDLAKVVETESVKEEFTSATGHFKNKKDKSIFKHDIKMRFKKISKKKKR